MEIDKNNLNYFQENKIKKIEKRIWSSERFCQKEENNTEG